MTERFPMNALVHHSLTLFYIPYISRFIIDIHPTFSTLVHKNREISIKCINTIPIFNSYISNSMPFHISHMKWEMSEILRFQSSSISI